MDIFYHDFTNIANNPNGERCEQFVKRMDNIYAAHHKKLPDNYWEQQGKHQYIELAHTLIKRHNNIHHIQNSQCTIFIYMSPEFQAARHLGPAFQQRYRLQQHCYDIIDCHYHALAYALQLGSMKLDQHNHVSIICLEHSTNHTLHATPHQTSQNSAALLCLSSTNQAKHAPRYQVTGIYFGTSAFDIIQKQHHLTGLRAITLITNGIDTERLLSHPHAISKTYLCISSGFSNVMFYLHRCLTLDKAQHQHIWIILHDPHELQASLIWIKTC